MKKYYEVGRATVRPNGEWGDEYTEYMGFDRNQAIEVHQDQIVLYGDNKKYEVFGKVYKVADELDENDLDAILEYIREEVIGYNPLEDEL